MNQSARRRHDALERRRSARETELERRRQLEQLEQISRQDARLSASARSMARHRIKAAVLVAARKTAAENASAAIAGGEGSSHRKDSSSFGARNSDANRLARRHQPQVFRGGEGGGEFGLNVQDNSSWLFFPSCFRMRLTSSASVSLDEYLCLTKLSPWTPLPSFVC